MALDDEQMRVLRELDEGTAWELPREVHSVEWDPDNRVASVPSESVEDDDDYVNPFGDTMSSGETIEGIMDLLDDMYAATDIKELIVIIGTHDDDQLMFTNIERNDIIIGQLSAAQMNWWNTQIEYRNEGHACDGEDIYD